MHPDAFLKRLRTELPQWIARGWIEERHRRAILEHAAERARRVPHHAPLALTLMGGRWRAVHRSCSRPRRSIRARSSAATTCGCAMP